MLQFSLTAPLWLLSIFYTFAAPLSVLSNPSLQLPTLNTTRLSTIEWPPAPFRFSIPDAFMHVDVVIKEYGPPGPSPVRQAIPLLSALAKTISEGGDQFELIGNLTQSRSGVVAKFTDTGNGLGMTRLQASRLLLKMKELTRAHGAVGVKECDVDFFDVTMEKFELEWMFE
ncbi:hypothetical protein ACLMJK_008666 [Lecanora helva]